MTPVYYSHPRQLPNPPSFGSLSNYYSSYSAIINEAGGPIPTPDEVTQQADHEAHILRRVAILRADGRTLENPDRTVSAEYVRAKDHQDNLVEQALYFSKLVHEERKSHVLLARKTAKMVMGHFERLKSKDEREAKELLSLQKNLARWTAREVKKKWKLAVNVRPLFFRIEAGHSLMGLATIRLCEQSGKRFTRLNVNGSAKNSSISCLIKARRCYSSNKAK